MASDSFWPVSVVVFVLSSNALLRMIISFIYLFKCCQQSTMMMVMMNIKPHTIMTAIKRQPINNSMKTS